MVAEGFTSVAHKTSSPSFDGLAGRRVDGRPHTQQRPETRGSTGLVVGLSGERQATFTCSASSGSGDAVGVGLNGGEVDGGDATGADLGGDEAVDLDVEAGGRAVGAGRAGDAGDDDELAETV